ncbi:MAG TPA: methylmalonyl-CoA mutase family protein, partial [Anaerolineae bacterium]|nr:methylmalonyl-CoA mutase family protein [Anaerolineae bacterium]
RRIVAEMQRVDDEMGGIVHAVSEGAVQREVAYQALKVEQGIQNGTIAKIGVNRYRLEGEQRGVQLHEYDPEQAEESIRRTNEVRASRDAQAVATALAKVRDAASSGQNVMPAIMDAVRAYATLGEITQTLKQVFGVFREPVRL